MRCIIVTYLILSTGLVVSCRTGSNTPSLDKRLSNLEATVDSLRRENVDLQRTIQQMDSTSAQTILDLEERIVYLENIVSDMEWGVYGGRK